MRFSAFQPQLIEGVLMKNVPARRRGLGQSLKSVSVAVSLCLLLAVAPGPSSDAGKGAPGLEDGPFRVGVYLDLSGQTSTFGVSTLNGIKMAADEINARGGVIGRRIKLIVKDEQGHPGYVVGAVEDLIKEEKVHALLGEVASTNTMAAAPLAQEAKIPMITPSSTNPDVTKKGDYIFRVCFIDPFQGEVMAKFAATTLKARRAAILTDPNSLYSQWLVDTFKPKFIALGGRIVREATYTQTDRDFEKQLAAIRAARPDVIYLPGYYGQVGVIVKQAREMGMKQPFLGGDGWDAPELWKLGGKALNNSYMSNHFSSDDPSPSVLSFVAGYTNRYGSASDALAALGYDAMMLLADALQRAGTTDGPKLRDAIAETRSFPGVTGPISINAERDAVKPAVILRLFDGKFLYRETVYPDE
jgi:branched-chain amino acid transport system substrate-binding protein